jgi:two-component sensor histidine kinase
MTVRRRKIAGDKKRGPAGKTKPAKRAVRPGMRDAKADPKQTSGFSARLTQLLSKINALSKSEDVDTLCRQAVGYSLEGIGFDRAGIWLFAEDGKSLVGKFGTDTLGRLQDERGLTLPLDHPPIQAIFVSREPALFIKQDELRNEQAEVVGKGDHVMAGLWNGEQAVGFFAADNLITGRRITVQQKELLGLLAVSVGHLCTLKRAEERIRAEIREKEMLVRETNHRVKNNMQIIASLLNLQARQTTDPAVVRMFRESRLRIQAMAQVHEMLYSSHVPARLDFGRYVESLTEKLKVSFGTDRKGIVFLFDTETVLLDVDAAVPCGLIVQELISNVLKYAFPEGWAGNPEVRISVHQPDGDCEMTVRDNGAGLPASLDFENVETLGLSLVRMLGRDQLKGTLDIRSAPGEGTEFRIRFKPKE